MEMRKIVINVCYGGFHLSEEARAKLNTDYADKLERDNPKLVAIVEEMGIKAANGYLSELKIVEIPADVEWTIQDYDGVEWVCEKHRTWG